MSRTKPADNHPWKTNKIIGRDEEFEIKRKKEIQSEAAHASYYMDNVKGRQ